MSKCKCSAPKKDATPKDVKTNTLVTPDDFGRIETQNADGSVTDVEVEEATVMINPDVESMDSRG